MQPACRLHADHKNTVRSMWGGFKVYFSVLLSRSLHLAYYAPPTHSSQRPTVLPLPKTIHVVTLSGKQVVPVQSRNLTAANTRTRDSDDNRQKFMASDTRELQCKPNPQRCRIPVWIIHDFRPISGCISEMLPYKNYLLRNIKKLI